MPKWMNFGKGSGGGEGALACQGHQGRPSNLPESAINLLVTGACLVYGSSAATLPQ